jgi:hypothetical protein
MPRAFISGHRDLTQDEFNEHYVPLIDKAIAEGCDFVVGDARGADTMAQVYLAYRWIICGCKVTVFHMSDSPRVNKDRFPTRGGYQSDDERDAAMTAASDFDIAWVRSGYEDSGTAQNIARRKKQAARDEKIDQIGQ